MSIWNWLTTTYLSLAFLTFLPTLWAICRGTELKPGGASFDVSPHFSEEARQLLNQHYSRINGTLSFWKSEAAKNARFHYYCLWWSIISSALMPIFTQFIEKGADVKWLLTAVSIHIALILGFHKGLRVAENFRAFRHGESEFYDLYRRMLDMPKRLGDTEQEQVDRYFEQVEALRRLIRNAETDNLPTLDNIRTPQRSGPTSS